MPWVRSRWLCIDAGLEHAPGRHYHEGTAEAEAIWKQAQAAGNDRAAIIALNAIATSAIDQGHLNLGQNYAEEIVRRSDRLISGRFRSYELHLLAKIACERADRGEALRLADSAWAEAEASAVCFCGLGYWWSEPVPAEAGKRVRTSRRAPSFWPRVPSTTITSFRREALEYGIERQARAFEAYLGADGTASTDLVLRRVRFLAAIARDRSSVEPERERKTLLHIAAAQGLGILARALRD